MKMMAFICLKKPNDLTVNIVKFCVFDASNLLDSYPIHINIPFYSQKNLVVLPQVIIFWEYNISTPLGEDLNRVMYLTP